jgi:hypothetical protein
MKVQKEFISNSPVFGFVGAVSLPEVRISVCD